MIKCFLFDMDGVLADSESISITIGREYFETLGFYTDKTDFDKHLGIGEEEFFTGVARDKNIKGYSYSAASKFFKEHYEPYLMNEKIDFSIPGSINFVKMAKKAGFKIAIASSAPKWKVFLNVEKLGLNNYVDLIVTGEDVKKNKPDGEIYEFCTSYFGLKGSEALVFEDSKGGIKAGKRAGANVVALLTTINLYEALKSEADVIVTNLSAFPNFSTCESFNVIFEKMKKERSKDARDKIFRNEEKREEEALRKAYKALSNSYSPYSLFKVGASLISSETGKIYSGTNVENASFGATICAERSAIFNAISEEGKFLIDTLYVVSDTPTMPLPCASCLQVISEFAKKETKIILLNGKRERKEYYFSSLLPHPFSFSIDTEKSED